MPKYNNFRRFISRLKRLRLKPAPPALSRVISDADLTQIFDYFTLNKAQIDVIDPSVKQTDNKNQFLINLMRLPSGQAMRLAKEETGLARTLNIIRKENGRYQLYLETKSKLADNTKQVLPNIRGTKKKGKPVWRLGTDFEEYFNLTIYVSEDIEGFKREVELLEEFKDKILTLDEVIYLLQQTDVYLSFEDELKFNRKIIDKKYVIEYERGASFIHHNQYKASFYAKKALGTLYDVIKSKIQITKEEQFAFLEMLLKGLDAIHSSNIAHQDIKPENILVFRDAGGESYIKIADFGLSAYHADKSENAICTPMYHSPEIALYTFVLDEKSYMHMLYHAKSDSQQWYANKILYTGNKVELPDSYCYPHILNDCWSAGMVIYELFTRGEYPTKDKSELYIWRNPLLRGLLAPEREDRISASDAMQILKNHKPLIFSQMFDKSILLNSRAPAIKGPEKTNDNNLCLSPLDTIEELCEEIEKINLISTNEAFDTLPKFRS